MEKRCLVKVPVADLRKEPLEAASVYSKDPLQLTQLLYGEQVLALGAAKAGWQQVEAIEQSKFYGKEGWRGYIGWVEAKYLREVAVFPEPKSVVTARFAPVFSSCHTDSPPLLTLSLATRLSARASDEGWARLALVDGSIGYMETRHLREDCPLDKIFELVGDPYHWGGRSAYSKAHIPFLTGVDCSALVHLFYRLQGIAVPRDAHDLFLASKAIEPKNLQIGDLAFTAPLRPQARISHVMLYVGDLRFLEATITVNQVRFVTADKKWGLTMESLYHGKEAANERILFGSLQNIN